MTSSANRIPQDIALTLVDPFAYADGRIHQSYKWLRANQPLGVAEVEGVDPFWAVTRHADILEVSRRNADFHSGDRQTVITSQDADRKVREMTGGSPHLLRTLVQMDAPDHPKYRLIAQGWFAPPNIKTREERVRKIARQSVERMLASGGRCDFVKEVALYYPLRVIMEILGVPEADEPRMLKLTQELFGAADPELGRNANVEEARVDFSVVTDFLQYFAAMAQRHRAEPGDTLGGVIANAQIDGRPMSDFEATSYYIIVATAGHDTTSSSTAGAMWALAEDPEQFAKIKADPSLIPGLVDEAIRWTTPVKTFMRSATLDTEVNGTPIAKGDWMMLCYASGNRDETVFNEPDRFRADRNPNKHLAFGYGAHLCLGQHLAKMEMRILFEELLPRLKSIELAGEPKMSAAVFVNGPKSLPLAFEAA
jgi:cytochrome P450